MAGLEAARARGRKGGRKPIVDEKKLAPASKMGSSHDLRNIVRYGPWASSTASLFHPVSTLTNLLAYNALGLGFAGATRPCR